MIDIKDLRIGNIVLGENNELIEVETIHYDGVNYMDGHIYGTNFNDLKPIKLTPEILKQVGFEKTKDFDDDDLYDFEESNYRKLTLIKLRGYDAFRVMDVDNRIDIKFLHDLQNTFYIFNNKQELPIDINTLKI